MDPRLKRRRARIAATCGVALLVFGLVPLVLGGGGAAGSLFLPLFMLANLVGGLLLLVVALVWNSAGLVELVRSRSSRMTSKPRARPDTSSADSSALATPCPRADTSTYIRLISARRASSGTRAPQPTAAESRRASRKSAAGSAAWSALTV